MRNWVGLPLLASTLAAMGLAGCGAPSGSSAAAYRAHAQAICERGPRPVSGSGIDDGIPQLRAVVAAYRSNLKELGQFLPPAGLQTRMGEVLVFMNEVEKDDAGALARLMRLQARGAGAGQLGPAFSLVDEGNGLAARARALLKRVRVDKFCAAGDRWVEQARAQTKS